MPDKCLQFSDKKVSPQKRKLASKQNKATTTAKHHVSNPEMGLVSRLWLGLLGTL